VRYAATLGARDPTRRRSRIENFGDRYGLTETEREYIDLISREIPYADMQHVFGVSLSTKNFHFGQLRERVNVKRREELTWLFFNQEPEGN
jgi:DNA-binding CsgD family transcriptional regulator